MRKVYYVLSQIRREPGRFGSCEVKFALKISRVDGIWIQDESLKKQSAEEGDLGRTDEMSLTELASARGGPWCINPRLPRGRGRD